METIKIIIFTALGIKASVGIGIGFDYRKRSSWIFIICGSLFGLGFTGVIGGLIAAFITTWAGKYMLEVNRRLG